MSYLNDNIFERNQKIGKIEPKKQKEQTKTKNKKQKRVLFISRIKKKEDVI